jgi:hypothetical protein
VSDDLARAALGPIFWVQARATGHVAGSFSGVQDRSIDVKKAQLFLAKMDIATNDVEGVLSILNTCPLYLNSFLISGRFNLTVLLVGENIRSIMSCVDSHLRKISLIKDMEFSLVVTPIRNFVVPIKPNMDKKKITPCGTNCSSCALYMNDRCLGCPVSTDYKGDLL